MAKAKYKIGTLVKTQEGVFGEINSVTTTREGFTYGLGEGLQVGESDISNAYRPIVERQARKPRASTGKKGAKPKNKEAAVAAH